MNSRTSGWPNLLIIMHRKTRSKKPVVGLKEFVPLPLPRPRRAGLLWTLWARRSGIPLWALWPGWSLLALRPCHALRPLRTLRTLRSPPATRKYDSADKKGNQ